jgi:hypothetical protein
VPYWLEMLRFERSGVTVNSKKLEVDLPMVEKTVDIILRPGERIVSYGDSFSVLIFDLI